jgi:hypothetical protein
MRIQREGAELQPRGMRSAGSGDDQARFLADLRALRDAAAIGYDELASRAHYPSDILKEAENGPYLPNLPILAAYVRACEGDVPEWEERWRRLVNEASGDPGLPVRPAGASPAAVAGARAGVGVVPPDVYDPERIKAALRGGHQRSEQTGRRAGARGTTASTASTASTAGSGGTSWSFADAGSAGSGTTEVSPAGWDAPTPQAGWDTAGPAQAEWDATDASPGRSATDGAAGWSSEGDVAAGWGATDARPDFHAADDAAEWSAGDGATGSWGVAAGARDGAGDSAGWGAGAGWDTAADQGIASANGNHQAKHRGGGPAGAWIDQAPELAEREETTELDRFAGSWSHDSELSPGQPGAVSAWPDLAGTEPEPLSQGTEANSWESVGGELALPELADTELAPDARGDELAGTDPSGGDPEWSAAEAGLASADGGLTWPGADTRPGGDTRPGADTWPGAREAAAPEPVGWKYADQALTQRVKPAASPASGSDVAEQAQPRPEPAVAGTSAPTARLQTASPEPSQRQQDRFYPLRLLLIIVIAALIGSGLVLLFK